MITKYYSTNKTYETIGLGEVNLLKNIGLREISMKILLPNDLTLPFIQPRYTPNSIIGKPILYLSKFREFKANKKPIQLLITRILPNGEELFKGNILVSLEEYTVHENAGEEGDFTVYLVFKEYRSILSKNAITLDKERAIYSIFPNRTHKETKKTYTVRKGDTLWKIAKRELNDEKLYKKIMEINSITEPKNLQIGKVLILP